MLSQQPRRGREGDLHGSRRGRALGGCDRDGLSVLEGGDMRLFRRSLHTRTEGGQTPVYEADVCDPVTVSGPSETCQVEIKQTDTALAPGAPVHGHAIFTARVWRYASLHGGLVGWRASRRVGRDRLQSNTRGANLDQATPDGRPVSCISTGSRGPHRPTRAPSRGQGPSPIAACQSKGAAQRAAPSMAVCAGRAPRSRPIIGPLGAGSLRKDMP